LALVTGFLAIIKLSNLGILNKAQSKIGELDPSSKLKSAMFWALSSGEIFQ
jgi:hypothetical protein